MTSETPTEFWNDSCSAQTIRRAIAQGAVGATTNPFIISEVLRDEIDHWTPQMLTLITHYPFEGEDQIAQRITRLVASERAQLSAPGSLAIQTDPRRAFDAEAMVQEGINISAIAPNIYVKIPATDAGIQAVETLSSRGINTLTTVCFSVAQAVAAAEAAQRGMEAGGTRDQIQPLCAVMIGRLDDWMRSSTPQLSAEASNWAGLAVIKRAYAIIGSRGYKMKLMSAAYRSILHWSELVGGSLIQTIPPSWQDTINASGLNLEHRMDASIPEVYLAELHRVNPDFLRAYDPEGLAREDFVQFPPTRRTLRQFLGGLETLHRTVRDRVVPEPQEVYLG